MYEDDLFPEIHVICHHCSDALAVPAGLNAVEAVWMHEPDCRALQQEESDAA